MAQNGPYAKLSCETLVNDKGETELTFSGATRNAAPPIDSGESTQFSGVADQDGNNIRGNYKEFGPDGLHVELSVNTDGSGFQEIPELPQRSLAEIAKDALSGPAKACSRQMLPWAPS